MPGTAALQSIQSISDITSQVRHTSGDIPPPLVGASVTVLNGHAYVFAGRLVSSRKMTNSLYILDLQTLQWTRHIPTPDNERAANPRYFHSAEAYQNQIIFFGGMGYSRESADGLCVLDDVSVLDVNTLEWKHHTIETTLFSPRPRYAHLSSIVQNTLVVVGGQDMTNSYIEEINVLDLHTWKWINVKPFEKHVGAYRSIAVTAPSGAHFPTVTSDAGTAATKPTGTTMANNNSDHQQQQVVDGSIYMYSNYNFADVRRELQMISSTGNNTKPIQDCSSLMSGSAMPPGLRFPAGHILGHHLILTGTYLTPQTHSFSIWLMNLSAMSWSRVETGSIFSTGSWNRSILSQDQNKLMVFGHRDRDLLTDYNHRQVNYDHLAVVDMEAFGAYRLPVMTCSPLAQEMGLSLLNEPGVSDFSIITRENSVIPINSAILRRRWPYFDHLMKENVEVVTVKEDTVEDDDIIAETEVNTEASTLASTDATIESTADATPTTQTSNGSIEDSETVTGATLSVNPAAPAFVEEGGHNTTADDEAGHSTEYHGKLIAESPSQDVSPRPSTTSHLHSEVTIKSHALHFPHTSQVIIAFLQFIYTDNLLTAQQHQPHILSQLLLLADMYDIPRLKDLATHALHQMLNMSTAALIFETAALSHQTSLQIRSLKMMIAAKKLIQQQQQNSRSSVTVSPRPSLHTPPPSASTISLDSAAQMHSPRSVASTSSYMSATATTSPMNRFDSNSRMSLLDQGHYMTSPGHQPGSPNGSIRSRTASLTRTQSTRRSMSGNSQSPYMAFSSPMNSIIPEQDDSDYTNSPRQSTSTHRPNLDLSDEASSAKDEPTSSGKKFMSLKKSKKSSDGKEKKPFLEAFSSKLASFAH
jgi:Kelch motif/BTB/POZ domain